MNGIRFFLFFLKVFSCIGFFRRENVREFCFIFFSFWVTKTHRDEFTLNIKENTARDAGWPFTRMIVKLEEKDVSQLHKTVLILKFRYPRHSNNSRKKHKTQKGRLEFKIETRKNRCAVDLDRHQKEKIWVLGS